MEVAAWFLLWSIAPVFITSLKPQSSTPRLPQSTMVKHQIFGVERDIDIPADVFPTENELQEFEDLFAGVKSEHGWFDSCYGGAKLHYQKWLPAGKPKAIIIYMHGIQSNAVKGFTCKESGRKVNTPLLVDDYVKKEGYALYAHDMYGHGFSEGKRWLIPGSCQTNVNDNVAFCNLVAALHEDDDVPVILMGESYGCTVTIMTARKFQDNPSCGPKNFDSVILTAPAIMGDMPAYPVYLVLRYILAPSFPAWSPFFMPNPVSAERIWKDPEVLARRTAPRWKEMMVDGSGRPFRLGTAVGLVVAMDTVRAEMAGFKVPYCIVHGTEDAGVLIEGSEYMWDKTATPAADKAFKRQEGGYHDLFSDPTAEDSVQFTVDYIKKRIAAKK